MKKKISVIIILILCIAAGIIFWLLSNTFGDDYVLKIGDIKISSKEYMVYLYEQKKHFEETGGTDIWETDIDGVSAEDLAKQNAADTIADVKSAIAQADKLNITLTDEELSDALTESENFYTELSSEGFEKFGITKDDLYKIISEGKIRTKVFDYITSGFTVDEQEFEDYFEDYFNQNKADLVNMKVLYIFKGFSKEKNNFEQVYSQMREIYNRAKNGEDFSSLVNQYSERDEKGEISVKKGLFENNVENVICEVTEKDTLTEIIPSSNGFYIFYISDVVPINKEAVKNEEKENYIKHKKDDLYRSQSEKWLKDFVVEKKDDVFSSIKIDDLSENQN